jgi:hypothetical protein
MRRVQSLLEFGMNEVVRNEFKSLYYQRTTNLSVQNTILKETSWER